METHSTSALGVERPLSRDGTLDVRIAGVTIQLTCADMALRLDPALVPFVVHGGSPDIRVVAGWGDLSRHRGGATLFDSGPLWQLCAEDDGFLFRFMMRPPAETPYKIARFDADFSHGEVVLDRSALGGRGAVYPLEYPLDELMLIHHLARGIGVEIHGCGILQGSGAGYLFAGHSGAGKSTMARLWIERTGTSVLSDDRVVLRNVDGQFRIYGTPWHGDEPLASPAGAPLAGILFLARGEEHQRVPLSPAQAVARLFACSFPPFHSAAGLEFVLQTLQEAAEAVPCEELRFTPRPDVVDFLLETLR